MNWRREKVAVSRKMVLSIHETEEVDGKTVLLIHPKLDMKSGKVWLYKAKLDENRVVGLRISRSEVRILPGTS